MMTTNHDKLLPRAALLALATLTLTGCIGVKLTAAGAQVRQASPADIAACQLVGKVTSDVPSKTLGRLSPGKVQEQLIVLARNEAPGLNGDTVVPRGPAISGHQEFDVYRCR